MKQATGYPGYCQRKNYKKQKNRYLVRVIGEQTATKWFAVSDITSLTAEEENIRQALAKKLLLLKKAKESKDKACTFYLYMYTGFAYFHFYYCRC